MGREIRRQIGIVKGDWGEGLLVSRIFSCQLEGTFSSKVGILTKLSPVRKSLIVTQVLILSSLNILYHYLKRLDFHQSFTNSSFVDIFSPILFIIKQDLIVLNSESKSKYILIYNVQDDNLYETIVLTNIKISLCFLNHISTNSTQHQVSSILLQQIHGFLKKNVYLMSFIT